MIFEMKQLLHMVYSRCSKYSSVKLREEPELLLKEKKLVLYCAKGILSYDAAEELAEKV